MVHGTQVVAVGTVDGVVLAADSRINIKRSYLQEDFRLDGLRKIATFTQMPNTAIVATGATRWLSDGVMIYTGTEPVDVDVKGLASDYIEAKGIAPVDEAYFSGLGEHVAACLTHYFASKPQAWNEWNMLGSGGILYPGWCKIILVHQFTYSVIATVRLMRGDRFPFVTVNCQFDTFNYTTGSAQFITSGPMPHEKATRTLHDLFRAVPGMITQPLTGITAALVAKAFIAQVAAVYPDVGGRVDAVLISNNNPPKDL